MSAEIYQNRFIYVEVTANQRYIVVFETQCIVASSSFDDVYQKLLMPSPTLSSGKSIKLQPDTSNT